MTDSIGFWVHRIRRAVRKKVEIRWNTRLGKGSGQFNRRCNKLLITHQSLPVVFDVLLGVWVGMVCVLIENCSPDHVVLSILDQERFVNSFLEYFVA